MRATPRSCGAAAPNTGLGGGGEGGLEGIWGGASPAWSPFCPQREEGGLGGGKGAFGAEYPPGVFGVGGEVGMEGESGSGDQWGGEQWGCMGPCVPPPAPIHICEGEKPYNGNI